MKRIMALVPIAVAALTLCQAATPSPVGKWSGRFIRNSAPLPKAKSEAEAKAYRQILEMMTTMRAKFTVKSDHTFTMAISGTLGGKPRHTLSWGTWKLDRMVVVTTSLKMDGKPLAKDAQTVNKLTLSKDGKKLTRLYNYGPIQGAIVLNKA